MRLRARAGAGPSTRHQLYFIAAGTGRYRVEDKLTAVNPGDVLLCAAHVAHGFEDISADFSVWVLFYEPHN
jgi:quercetin dioxygenase-like cupin family protein